MIFRLQLNAVSHEIGLSGSSKSLSFIFDDQRSTTSIKLRSFCSPPTLLKLTSNLCCRRAALVLPRSFVLGCLFDTLVLLSVEWRITALYSMNAVLISALQ